MTIRLLWRAFLMAAGFSAAALAVGSVLTAIHLTLGPAWVLAASFVLVFGAFVVVLSGDGGRA